jgi:phage/plasmid-like protein (TIGR03299 family)
MDQKVTTRTVPWMQWNTEIVDNPMTSAEALKAGGLDFTVSLREIQFNKSTDPDLTHFVPAPSRKAVVRDDTNNLFEVVSSTYAPLQYADAFSFLDGINPEFVAAGSLKDGRQGFMVIQLPEQHAIQMGLDDPHELYVIIRTSHDRSRGIEVSVMPLRGKCMNSLGIASFSMNAPQRWSITHTGDVLGKMHNAEKVILGAKAYATEFAQMVERLQAVKLDAEQATKILRRVIRQSPKQEDAVQQVLGIWNTAETVALGNTGWGLTNAVSDYFEWNRKGGSPQSQILGVLEGVTTKAISRTAALVLSRS